MYVLVTIGRLAEYLLTYYIRVLFGVLLFALLIVSGRIGIRRIPWLYFLLRLRVHPPRSFTPDQWRQRMRSYSAARQAELIVRTDHQSVGVTPAEFLDVLDGIVSVIEAEPALSTYWQYRAELEQVLKQERQG
jgi:hypothetical protein